MTVKEHPEYEELLPRISGLRSMAVSWQGVTYRSVRPTYWRSGRFLSGVGSAKHGGRWNPPGFRSTVYLALSTDTAYLEWKAWCSRYGLAPKAALPRVFAAVDVCVQDVLDLSDGRFRQRLRVSGQRMIEEDWEGANASGEEALTQAIGRAACEENLEGLLVPSAQDPDGRNLVLFPNNLAPHSVMTESKFEE